MEQSKTKIYAPTLIPNLHGRNHAVKVAYSDKEGKFAGTSEYQNITKTLKKHPSHKVMKSWQNKKRYQQILNKQILNNLRL